MSKIHIVAAMGNAPEKPINAAATTDLDTVDSNRVHVVGPIAPDPVVTITSFGPGTLVEKRVRFDSRVIIKHNPPNLILISAADRTTNAGDVGKYYADANGVWREEEWNAASWTQTITVGSNTRITCPVGFNSAFIQLVGGGGRVPTGGAGHFGANAGYAEKTVQAIPGLYASLTIGVAGSASRFFTAVGGSPPPPYPDTWNIGDIIANAATSGFSAPAGGTASGGDVNITGALGAFDAGTGIASMPAGAGSSKGVLSVSPAQSINSGHAIGALYGGGALVLDGATATNGGAGVCFITWRR